MLLHKIKYYVGSKNMDILTYFTVNDDVYDAVSDWKDFCEKIYLNEKVRSLSVEALLEDIYSFKVFYKIVSLKNNTCLFSSLEVKANNEYTAKLMFTQWIGENKSNWFHTDVSFHITKIEKISS